MSEQYRHEQFGETEDVVEGIWSIDGELDKEDLEANRIPSLWSPEFYIWLYDPYCDFRVLLNDDISEDAVKRYLQALSAWVDAGGLEAIRRQR